MKYKITKQQCQDGIKGVCSQCGGQITPMETVDNSYNPTFWSGCVRCCRFDNGVDPLIYRTAKRMVEERHFNPYSHQCIEPGDSPETKAYKKEVQIGGVSHLVREIMSLYQEEGCLLSIEVPPLRQ